MDDKPCGNDCRECGDCEPTPSRTEAPHRPSLEDLRDILTGVELSLRVDTAPLHQLIERQERDQQDAWRAVYSSAVRG